mgnify:FL=1
MTMFDIHYWDYDISDHTEYDVGWESEIEAKLPVSELKIQTIRKVVFDEIVMPGNSNRPAVRATSVADFMNQTGAASYDGEQGIALKWKDALQQAGGQSDLSVYYVNIIDSRAGTYGGQAVEFGGVGSVTNEFKLITDVLHHELGHTLSLPHWGGASSYPYRGDTLGVPVRVCSPDPCPDEHVGPTWGYDDRTGTPVPGYSFPYFISPVVQPSTVPGGQNHIGTWKLDPMQGGGSGDQEQGFILRMFSDYSVYTMRNFLENRLAVWNNNLNSFTKWDDAAKSYSQVVVSDSIAYPTEHNVEEFTVSWQISVA